MSPSSPDAPRATFDHETHNCTHALPMPHALQRVTLTVGRTMEHRVKVRVEFHVKRADGTLEVAFTGHMRCGWLVWRQLILPASRYFAAALGVECVVAVSPTFLPPSQR